MALRFPLEPPMEQLNAPGREWARAMAYALAGLEQPKGGFGSYSGFGTLPTIGAGSDTLQTQMAQQEKKLALLVQYLQELEAEARAKGARIPPRPFGI